MAEISLKLYIQQLFGITSISTEILDFIYETGVMQEECNN